MAIQPMQMLVVGEFLEKHGASDGIMETFQAICEELVECQKPTTSTARDEICSWCEADSEISKHGGSSRWIFCPMCGRKLSPVA